MEGHLRAAIEGPLAFQRSLARDGLARACLGACAQPHPSSSSSPRSCRSHRAAGPGPTLGAQSRAQEQSSSFVVPASAVASHSRDTNRTEWARAEGMARWQRGSSGQSRTCETAGQRPRVHRTVVRADTRARLWGLGAGAPGSRLSSGATVQGSCRGAGKSLHKARHVQLGVTRPGAPAWITRDGCQQKARSEKQQDETGGQGHSSLQQTSLSDSRTRTSSIRLQFSFPEGSRHSLQKY